MKFKTCEGCRTDPVGTGVIAPGPGQRRGLSPVFVALLVFVAAICRTGVAGWTNGEARVFVALLENKTGDPKQDLMAEGVTDLLGLALAEGNAFTVLERQNLVLISEEQERTLANAGGPEANRLAGGMLKADIVIFGELVGSKTALVARISAMEIATARVLAKDEVFAVEPNMLVESSVNIAKKTAEILKRPIPELKSGKVEESPAAGLHYGKAILHYYAGDLNRALREFMLAVDVDPNYADAYYWSGYCYREMGEHEHAVIDFDRYLRDSPRGKYAATAREQRDASVKLVVPVKGWGVASTNVNTVKMQ